MKRFLLINSFLRTRTEQYYDSVAEFEASLFAAICGMAKVVRVVPDDTRASTVIEICDISKEYTL